MFPIMKKVSEFLYFRLKLLANNLKTVLISLDFVGEDGEDGKAPSLGFERETLVVECYVKSDCP